MYMSDFNSRVYLMVSYGGEGRDGYRDQIDTWKSKYMNEKLFEFKKGT